MASSFDKLKDSYKTYDTSKGYGSSKQWKKAFTQRMGIDEGKKRKKYAELENATTIDELNKAFRGLIKKYHPDVAGDTEVNKRKTQEIIERYEELKTKF